MSPDGLDEFDAILDGIGLGPSFGDLASAYNSLGINVLPVGPNKKLVGTMKWERWQTKRQSEGDLARLPFGEAIGLAAVCGAVSADPGLCLVCIDADRAPGEGVLLNLLGQLGLPRDYPWAVRTPGKGGGWHVWVRVAGLPEELARLGLDRGRLESAFPGTDHIEMRWNEAYTVLPGSAHPEGGTYRWEHGNGKPPSEPPTEVKAGRLVHLGKWKGATPDGSRAAAEPLTERIAEGAGRHPALASFAGTMRRRGATADEMLAALRPLNKRICEVPVEDGDLVHIAKSMMKYPPGASVAEMREGSAAAQEEEPQSRCAVNYEAPKPKTLGEAAYHGPLGDFVKAWAPHTEADPAAVLATTIVGFGSIVGAGPRQTVSGDVHPARLWAVVVGASSAARKGMSYKPARNLLDGVDPFWAGHCTASGLSTGEGLNHRVRDRDIGTVTDKKTGQETEIVEDKGVDDKRLFLLEPEFARVLVVMARKDNTLSAIARGLWDSGDAGVMTRTSPAATHGAHVCIVAHVTMEELRRALSDCDAANGFTNRFLWVYAERHGSLPFGGQADPKEVEKVRARLARAFIHAPEGEIGWTQAARDLWVEKYDGLLAAGGGLTGSIIARGQPQVLRLALVYALADDVLEIDRVHLEAALEVWRYCAESARYVFGERTGDNTADRILAELRDRGTMTRNDVRELFDRHKPSATINAALEMLRTSGLAESEKTPSGGGRPAEVWKPC